MLAGFISLTVILLAFIFQQITRYQKREDNPQDQHLDEYEKIDRDINRRDDMAATLHAGDELDRLERLRIAKGGAWRPGRAFLEKG